LEKITAGTSPGGRSKEIILSPLLFLLMKTIKAKQAENAEKC
jgi:hypothetical protein